MKQRFFRLLSLPVVLAVLICTCSCSINAYSVAELRELYPKAVAASQESTLFYWKETVNNGDRVSFRRCNVYAQIDKKYEPMRDANGDYSNMDVDIYEQSHGKDVLKLQCGDAPSANGADAQNYLLRTVYDSGTAVSQTKTPMSSKEYVGSAEFQDTYSLRAMLRELSYLTVGDMDFDNDLSNLTKKGHVVKITFQIKPDYLERYRTEFGKDSLFAGSKKVSMEFAYDFIASFVVFTEKNMDRKLSVDTEAYKLEIVYFGPKVNLPKYDEMSNGSLVWKDTQATG